MALLKHCRIALLAAVLLASCATGSMVEERLFFGTDIPSGGQVSDEEWSAFVRDVVTPRFKEGLTILDGNGQWLGADGKIARERVHILEIDAKPGPELDASLQAIASEYKKRFKQEAVLRITAPVAMKFY